MKGTTKGKRIGSFLLALAFTLSLLPALERSARAEDIEVSSWSELAAALQTDGNTVVLGANIAAAENDAPLTVASGVTVTLDLNGKTLAANGTMTAHASLGNINMAILVQSGGALTICDSGDGGTLDGGGATYGVYLDDGTATSYPVFALAGGTISSCKVGVKIMPGTASERQPTFTMTGGTISGNTCCGVSTSTGIYAIFNMSGGTITGNGGDAGSSPDNYGGVYISGGTFNMSGGSITANGGTYGGVCLNADIGTCILNMSGGSVTENTGSVSGGVYVNRNTSNSYPYTARLQISGAPEISGNTAADDAASNVCLVEGGDVQTVVTVTGELTDGASVGVTFAGAEADTTIARGDGYDLTEDDAEKFSYDGGDFTVELDETNNALLLGIPPMIVTTWAALQEALTADGAIVLGDDIASAENDTPLTLSSGTVTLDLAGHSIDNSGSYTGANVDNSDYNMTVYVSGGSLTVSDSVGDGTIAGGEFGVYAGGGTFTLSGGTLTGYKNYGVYISGGAFTLGGGTIDGSGSEGEKPGGVCVANGTFIMTGGEISGNTHGSYGGGGVSVSGAGTFTMNGGAIQNNTATSGTGFIHGGGVYVDGGTFTMNNGTIGGNTAPLGGGVSVENSGTFTMTGGTVAGNNVDAGGSGGGVYVKFDSTFNISGGAKVAGNVSGGTITNGTFSGGTANNVYLSHHGSEDIQAVVSVAGALTGAASVGVTVESGAVGDAAVQGGDYELAEADAAKFSYDNDDFTLVYDDTDKILLLGVPAVVKTETALRSALATASTDPENPTVITLGADVDTTAALTVGSGKYVTLDLNGYAIDRGLTAETATSNGFVIRVAGGSLTLRDTSEAGTGKITGGSNSNNSSAELGGGVSVYGGTFIMNGGVIIGNHGEVAGGGGVSVVGTPSASAAFTMNGGEIKNNTSQGTGGVKVDAHATFTMTGGKISGSSGNGVSIDADSDTYDNPDPAGGKLIMTGGEISGNGSCGVNLSRASFEGERAASFVMRGGTITGNGDGGVSIGYGNFSVSGDAVVTENTALDGTTSKNVYIQLSDHPITVAGALGENAIFGVTLDTGSDGTFTSGLSGKGTAANFTSDDDAKAVTLTAAGEAALATVYAIELDVGENGSVETETPTAISGAEVELIIEPNEGYELDVLTAACEDGTSVTITNGTFTMPAAAVAVTATFKPIVYAITYNLNGGAASGNPASYTIETASFTLVNPTKDGYVFAGWTGTELNAATMSVTVERGSLGARSYTATWTQAPAPAPEGIEWTLENGVLTITGAGAMEDYARGAAPWFARRAEIRGVVFRSTTAPITHIGDNAFYACGAIASVTVDNREMSVGKYAFAYCAGLRRVTDADGNAASFASAGDCAFYACFRLTDRPEIRGTFGNKAFELCGLRND